MINSGSTAIMFNKIRVANIILFLNVHRLIWNTDFFVNLCPRSFIGLSGDFFIKKTITYCCTDIKTTKNYPFSMLPNKECTLILVEKCSHFVWNWDTSVPIPQLPFFRKNNGTYQLFNLLFFFKWSLLGDTLALLYLVLQIVVHFFFWLILSHRIMD